ncbi:MAG: hypothetical protein ACON5B_16985 [Myxococcota bacterium]
MVRIVWQFSVLGLLACSRAGDGEVQRDTALQPTNKGPAAHAIFVVHLEPGAVPVDTLKGGPSLQRPALYWPALLDLVALADAYGHKLTLMLTPQWARYILGGTCTMPTEARDATAGTAGDMSATCLDAVREMEAHGHEIAVHHHPVTAPAGWDGFTDEATWQADRDGDGLDEVYFSDGGGPHGADPWYLGNLDALMGWIEPVPADGRLWTATTEEFHPSLSYSMAGGPVPWSSGNAWGDLVSTPCVQSYPQQHVWELRMRLFTTPSVQRAVLDDELPGALAWGAAEAERAHAVALVTHAKNVADGGLDAYEELFSTLAVHGLVARSVEEVMGQLIGDSEEFSSVPEALSCDANPP